MNLALSPWQSRGAALALLAALIVGLGAATVWPLWQFNREGEARIHALHDQLRRFGEFAGARPALEARRRQLVALQRGGGYYLQGATATLAAAELQRVAKEAVAADGGSVLSTQMLPVPAAGDFQKVAIRVHMRGGVETLRSAFHRLETGKPYLFLDNVTIRAWNVAIRSRAGMQAAQLDVHFDLFGYLLPPQP